MAAPFEIAAHLFEKKLLNLKVSAYVSEKSRRHRKLNGASQKFY